MFDLQLLIKLVRQNIRKIKKKEISMQTNSIIALNMNND